MELDKLFVNHITSLFQGGVDFKGTLLNINQKDTQKLGHTLANSSIS